MGQTEAGNLMSAFHAGDALAKTKLENRNYKKGFLGYVGGFKGAIEDTTSGILFGQSMQGLAEGAEDYLDPRSYTEEGRKEKDFEAIKKGIVEGDENLQRIYKDFPHLKPGETVTGVFNKEYDDVNAGDPANYTNTVANIKNNTQSITPSTTPSITPSITPLQVNQQSNYNSNGVTIPVLISGKVVFRTLAWWIQNFKNEEN